MYQTSIRNKKKHVSFNRDRDINYEINTYTEEYAYVVKLLGNCRAKILSNTGEESIGVIRGSLRKFSKRILIENGDIVVISKRDYQKDKVDIVHKFNADQAHHLIKTKQISQILINCYNKQPELETTNKEDNYDDYIQFEDASSNSEDEYLSSNELDIDDSNLL